MTFFHTILKLHPPCKVFNSYLSLLYLDSVFPFAECSLQYYRKLKEGVGWKQAETYHGFRLYKDGNRLCCASSRLHSTLIPCKSHVAVLKLTVSRLCTHRCFMCNCTASGYSASMAASQVQGFKWVFLWDCFHIGHANQKVTQPCSFTDIGVSLFKVWVFFVSVFPHSSDHTTMFMYESRCASLLKNCHGDIFSDKDLIFRQICIVHLTHKTSVIRGI